MEFVACLDILEVDNTGVDGLRVKGRVPTEERESFVRRVVSDGDYDGERSVCWREFDAHIAKMCLVGCKRCHDRCPRGGDVVQCGDGAQECGCCYGYPEGHERYGVVSLFEESEAILVLHKRMTTG